MSTLGAISSFGTACIAAGGWPRMETDAEGWRAAVEALASGDACLWAFWSDGASVFLALMDPDCTERLIVSLASPGGRFPSVAARFAPAQRLERTIHDLYGLTGEGAPDVRPWLDHQKWPVQFPNGARSAVSPQTSYAFLKAEGAPLHQIPVGPVHAGIIEPGHFRFTANGETVVRLEERLGYVHKGVEGLMRGAPIATAARIAGRISGDSTVAYAIAFSRAVESVTGTHAPPRAQALRGVMAELERVANHLGDIGAICNDAAFSIMQAHCHILREQVLRACATCFTHRLMMDRVTPGGVTHDLDMAGQSAVRNLLDEIDKTFPHLVAVYESASSLQDRTVRTGLVSRNLVEQFSAGGFVGRATGRAFDARMFRYEPYDGVFDKPVLRTAGDVDARVWVRIDEIKASIHMIRHWLGRLPDGPISVSLNARNDETCEGASLVESFRGDLFCWLRIKGDVIEHCHIRDPSWFQWPLLEAAIEGNIVADFPLCNKSFNCSYSGHDL